MVKVQKSGKMNPDPEKLHLVVDIQEEKLRLRQEKRFFRILLSLLVVVLILLLSTWGLLFVVIFS